MNVNRANESGWQVSVSTRLRLEAKLLMQRVHDLRRPQVVDRQGDISEVDKGLAEKEKEKEEVHFKRKQRESSSRGRLRKKQVMSKPPRRAREVFFIGEEESTAYTFLLAIISLPSHCSRGNPMGKLHRLLIRSSLLFNIILSSFLFP